MKFYPCFVIAKDELMDATHQDITFKNGRIADNNVRIAIENFVGHPVAMVRESTANTDEVFVFTADGYIQVNPLSKKRTAVLIGNYDNLKVILSDIFHERPDEDPYEIFCEYSYQTDINIQLDLQGWVRDEYQP